MKSQSGSCNERALVGWGVVCGERRHGKEVVRDMCSAQRITSCSPSLGGVLGSVCT